MGLFLFIFFRCFYVFFYKVLRTDVWRVDERGVFGFFFSGGVGVERCVSDFVERFIFELGGGSSFRDGRLGVAVGVGRGLG